MNATSTTIEIPALGEVSGLWTSPAAPVTVLVLAHGAGAGMQHPFLATFASALAAREIATLRFQFLYMERGSRRPDTPKVAQAAVVAACEAARTRFPGLPLFAGGKSFGGRMTSQAQAEGELREIGGVVFLGFPLHPAGNPSVRRAEHLPKVTCPMLFLQGSRDALADLELLKGVVAKLGPRATLEVYNDADHSFHVRVQSGSTDATVLAALADAASRWMLATGRP